ncbi:hypothetical protein GYMLUDRAFT_99281 [Collybiopsis luxurians FD-317 M1]|uniref:cytochrome-b5 reductase n=1 Tax=Collybiopsis luxurians FD-317 M1 TaxID=944289 RepID=A0A0D0CM82_9AGAR|nr:hypothetical protein GYMLUDRAFT_99281 [Collybiopsis luxurians FD-317 M1]
MDFRAISTKANLSEDTVELVCTGRLRATQAQYDAISKALGLGSDTVCVGRPLDGDSRGPEYIPRSEYDYTEACHLLRRAHLRRRVALDSGKRMKEEDGLAGPGHFTFLRLKAVVPYNDATSRFDFALDDENLISKPPVSSTCVVVSPAERPLWEHCREPVRAGNWDKSDVNIPQRTPRGRIPVFRAYTPVTDRDTPGIISFVIKKQPAVQDLDIVFPPGLMSNYIHEMKPGCRLGIMGYLQAEPSMLPYHKNLYGSVTLIGGGSGITPLIQILQYAFEEPVSTTQYLLLNANTTEKDIIMSDVIDAYEKKYPQYFRCIHVLSDPPEEWNGEKGRIDAELIKKYAPPPEDPTPRPVKVYVSGSPAMIDELAGPKDGNRYDGYSGQGELKGALKEVGYTKDQVGTRRFS